MAPPLKGIDRAVLELGRRLRPNSVPIAALASVSSDPVLLSSSRSCPTLRAEIGRDLGHAMAHGGGPTGAQGMLSPSPDAASDASTPDQALYLQQCEAQCCSPLATVMQQLGTRAAHLDLSNTPLDVAQLQCLLPVLQQTQHLQALELCNAGPPSFLPVF